jgi:hypothetical protein
MLGLLIRIRLWFLHLIEKDLESIIQDLEFELGTMGFQEGPSPDIATELLEVLAMRKEELKEIRLKLAIIKLRTEGPYVF